MLKFIATRVMLSFVTLVIILVLVTLIPNVAPGDPARQIAGGTASAERLAAVTESLGLDKSIPEQLVDSFRQLFTLDFGNAFRNQSQTVISLVRGALWNSMKLVGFSLLLLLPLSILGGVVAAYKKDTLIDRVIVNVGVALSSVPEFVVGVLLLAILAVPIGFFKVGANAPPGSGILTQMQHLLLPALTVLTVYFGYIARVTRASSITALDSDYSRTVSYTHLTLPTIYSV